MKIVIRVDGHKRIGMGHLYRMLTLARYLRKHKEAEVEFVIRNNRHALNLIQSFDFPVYPLLFNLSYADEARILESYLFEKKCDVVCVDLLKRCREKTYMSRLRRSARAVMVAFSDTHSREEIAADLVFNASVFQRPEYYGKEAGRVYFLGLDYVIMPEVRSEVSKRAVIRPMPEKILVCMGGSDHHDLTYNVLKAIDKSQFAFEIDVVVGSTFFPPSSMDWFASTLSHPTRVIYDPDGVYDLLSRSDLAITAGGTVLIERMRSGVPGLTISQLRHQAALAAEIARRGAGVDLGIYSDLSPVELTAQFEKLYSNQNMRRKISTIGRKMVDGLGLYRVAEKICEQIEPGQSVQPMDQSALK